MGTPSGLTVREASILTGYHPEHIRRLIRSGDIEAELVGLMYFINVQSLEEYLERMRSTGNGRYGPQR